MAGLRRHPAVSAQEKHDRDLAGVIGGLPVPGRGSIGAAKGRLHGTAQDGGIDPLAAFEMGQQETGGGRDGRRRRGIGTQDRRPAGQPAPRQSSGAALTERIDDPQAVLDQQAVVQILGIQPLAAADQGGCDNQRIVNPYRAPSARPTSWTERDRSVTRHAARIPDRNSPAFCQDMPALRMQLTSTSFRTWVLIVPPPAIRAAARSALSLSSSR